MEQEPNSSHPGSSSGGGGDTVSSLRTDSPVSLSIVASFLQFLNSVEAAPGTDLEGLEVAAQCLSEVFRLHTPQRDPRIRLLPLVELFKAGLDPPTAGVHARSSIVFGSDTATAPRVDAAAHSSGTTTKPGGSVSEVKRPSWASQFWSVLCEKTVGLLSILHGIRVNCGALALSAGWSISEEAIHAGPVNIILVHFGPDFWAYHADPAPSLRESLLEQFKDGLDLAGYFEGTMRDTPEYSNKLNEAKTVLEDAVKKVRSESRARWSVAYSDDTLALAEAFKTQGNATMTARRYHDAIQLYTLAISLCSNNAIFYANRAAALTQVSKYDEAIADCEVAIKLDPRYSKAYSRMGLVYFAQNRLQEAIEKGFLKAFEIDPGSTSIQENLRAAQQKLAEQQRSGQQQEQQRSGQHQHQQQQQQQPPRPPGDSQASGVFSTSTGSTNIPPEIATLLPGIINMAAQFGSQAHSAFSSTPSQSESNESTESTTSGGSIHSDSVPASRNGGDERQQGAYQDGHMGGGFGNFNVTVDGQQLPPQFAGLVQSVFQQMFGGGGVPGQTGPSPGSGTPSPGEAGWVPPPGSTNANPPGPHPGTPRAE